MMTEEHGLPPISRSPLRAALLTFLAFLLCGAIPLLPFVVGVPAAIWASTAYDRRSPSSPSARCGAVGRRPPGGERDSRPS